MEQSTWNRLGVYGPPVLALIGLALSVFLADNGWPSLNYDMELDEVIGVLGSLLVIALVLERALAVVNDLLFGAEKALSNVGVEIADEKLLQARVEQLQTADDFLSDAFTTTRKANEELEGAVEAQELVDEKRRRLRLGVGFLVAVLISGMGVRTLGELVEQPAISSPPSDRGLGSGTPAPTPPAAQGQPSPAPAASISPSPTAEANAAVRPRPSPEEPTRKAPRRLFDWLDVLLTAGLLAGGSNGIGNLIDALTRRRPAPTSTTVLKQLARSR